MGGLCPAALNKNENAEIVRRSEKFFALHARQYILDQSLHLRFFIENRVQ